MLSRRAVLAATLQSSARRPNIVLVLADDLGYGDLACQGNPIVRTPHLDRFARSGVRFTNAYSGAANCSPARSALMTGRTPSRLGIQSAIPMQSPVHLRASEVTVAALLRRAGYSTCHVGKWHLNGMFNLAGQPQPGDHGFDHWFSTQNNALPSHRDPHNFVRNGIPVGPMRGYAGDLVAAEADAWLRGRDKSKPFFLYACFHEPHEPIAAAEEHTRHYKSADPSERAYWGSVTQLDAAFGKLMAAIEATGEKENTLVVFTSDNGPAVTAYHPHGSTGGLRDKKGAVYEGGIRVPGVVRWPARVRAGQVSSEPISGVDFLPTACEAAGVAKPTDRAIDGASFLPALEGKPVVRSTPLYWHFHRAHSKMKVAMRDGRWKLLGGLTGPDPAPMHSIDKLQQDTLKNAELAGFELYDLEADPAESRDLAVREPQRVEAMAARLRPLFREVRDEAPRWPDWTHIDYEGPRIQWPPWGRKPPRVR